MYLDDDSTMSTDGMGRVVVKVHTPLAGSHRTVAKAYQKALRAATFTGKTSTCRYGR